MPVKRTRQPPIQSRPTSPGQGLQPILMCLQKMEDHLYPWVPSHAQEVARHHVQRLLAIHRHNDPRNAAQQFSMPCCQSPHSLLSVAVAGGGAAKCHLTPTRTSVLHRNLGSSSESLGKAFPGENIACSLHMSCLSSVCKIYACMHDEDREVCGVYLEITGGS